MIQLYQSMQSVCSGKVRLVLEEKGAAYEEIDINLQKGEQFDPKYKKLNPKAVVPTIIHNDKVIRESTLIMEYLHVVFSDPPLMPSDPYLKFRARLFPKMMDEETHVAVNLITYAVATRHVRAANYTKEELEAHFAQTSDPERARRQRLVHEEGTAAPVFARGHPCHGQGAGGSRRDLGKIRRALADGGRLQPRRCRRHQLCVPPGSSRL